MTLPPTEDSSSAEGSLPAEGPFSAEGSLPSSAEGSLSAPAETINPVKVLDDISVAAFLADKPNFFADKNELLMSMVVPHESGKAISLLERQLNVLRERNDNKQENIDSFIANAKANDELFEKIRTIILDILKTPSFEALTSLIEERLKDDFSASVSKLIFVSDNNEETNFSQLSLSAAKEALGKKFEQKRSFCCALGAKQANLLFPEQAQEIVSAAIIPVHFDESTRTEKVPGVPLLVIGSDKEHQFHSQLDTLFLDFIGEVLATHITRLFS